MNLRQRGAGYVSRTSYSMNTSTLTLWLQSGVCMSLQQRGPGSKLVVAWLLAPNMVCLCASGIPFTVVMTFAQDNCSIESVCVNLQREGQDTFRKLAISVCMKLQLRGVGYVSQTSYIMNTSRLTCRLQGGRFHTAPPLHNSSQFLHSYRTYALTAARGRTNVQN